MYTRGIRGAITVEKNEASCILQASQKLLQAMLNENKILLEDIASIIFTATPDLNASYPARAARELGLVDIPMLCFAEMNVINSLKMVIRILMHVNTPKAQKEIKHIYLEGAKDLRPDLVEE